MNRVGISINKLSGRKKAKTVQIMLIPKIPNNILPEISSHSLVLNISSNNFPQPKRTGMTITAERKINSIKKDCLKISNLLLFYEEILFISVVLVRFFYPELYLKYNLLHHQWYHQLQHHHHGFSYLQWLLMQHHSQHQLLYLLQLHWFLFLQ